MDNDNIVNQKLAWIKSNPSVCFWPYSKLDIRISPYDKNADSLQVSCCCNLSKPVYVDTFTQDPFTNLKKKLSDGYLPPECEKCHNEEITGGVSERARALLNYTIDSLENFKRTKKNDWFEITIFTSYVCNLSCRSCEPMSSSTYSKITKINDYDHLSIDISNTEKFWNIIINTIQEKTKEYDFVYIHFMGGEPLLHKGNIKILDWLLLNNLNEKIKIRVTTSLNIPINPQFAKKLSSFASVEFILSIDGAYDNYHYIRWPAKFDKTIQNLDEIVNYSKTLSSPFIFYLSPVVSLNNILYLDQYLDFWIEWKKKHNLYIFFMQTNLLPRTSHLDFQALPRVYRHHIKNFLKKLLSHQIIEQYKDHMFQLINFINSALYELEEYDDDLLLWDKFLTHTAEFDIRTNTHFSVYNQKLYDILDEFDKKLFAEKLNMVDTQQKISFW